MNNIKELKEQVKDIQVLFVEDEESIRVGMAVFLKKFFNHVIVCKDGEEGLEAFKNNNIGLVISDILMPKMNGVTMMKEIKKIKPDICSVFISAFRETLEDNTLVDIHIDKPISYEDIHLILIKVAQKKNLQE